MLINRRRITLDLLKWSSANTRRTPGVHLTDIIRDMLRMIGVGKTGGGKNSFTPQQLDDFALQGYLWEDIATSELLSRVKRTEGAAIDLEPGVFVRLPEIACNGQEATFIHYDERTGKQLTEVPPGWIIMSPDGGVIRQGSFGLLECKWTTKSVPAWDDSSEQARLDTLTRWLAEHRPDWMWQTPCYLRGLSLAMNRSVDTVEHHVQFPCGNYRGSGVIYEEWTNLYSEQEVDDRWSAVWQHAIDREMFRRGSN